MEWHNLSHVLIQNSRFLTPVFIRIKQISATFSGRVVPSSRLSPGNTSTRTCFYHNIQFILNEPQKVSTRHPNRLTDGYLVPRGESRLTQQSSYYRAIHDCCSDTTGCFVPATNRKRSRQLLLTWIFRHSFPFPPSKANRHQPKA